MALLATGCFSESSNDDNFEDEEPGTCVTYADFAFDPPMCMEEGT